MQLNQISGWIFNYSFLYNSDYFINCEEPLSSIRLVNIFNIWNDHGHSYGVYLDFIELI
jgi:hypothetical protein